MKRLGLSVLVGILTTIVVIILADALKAAGVPRWGDFLGGISGLLGVGAAIWFYLYGPERPVVR